MRANTERYLDEAVPNLPPAAAVTLEDDREGVAEGASRVVFLARMDQHDDWFANFRHDARLKNVAGDLLGGDVEAQHVQLLDIVPGICKATPPHQDAPIFSIEPSHAVTFWMPLVEADESNGCMHYVPGSHWQGGLPHAEAGPRRLADEGDSRDHGISVPASPGDVIAHHCHTIHYSAENLSGKNRWALALHFYPVGVRRLDEAMWLQRNTSR